MSKVYKVALLLAVTLSLVTAIGLNADMFKHTMDKMNSPGTPMVNTAYDPLLPPTGPFDDWWRNNMMMLIVLPVQWVCYLSGWLTLFWDDDYGTFYNECFSMWTLQLNFYRYPS
jgi:hypothetical protein